jgi:hypothetical protein
MARNRGNNLFQFSGTIGNIVAYQRHGKQCFRIKAKHVKDAKSIKQEIQRNRFNAVVQLSKKCLNEVLVRVWKRGAAHMTGYNLFVKKNIRLIDKNCEITDYENLKMSVGKLLLPSGFKIDVKLYGNCVITISWEYDSKEVWFNPKDRIQIVAIINSEVIHVRGLTATRIDKTATFQLSCGGGSRIHLYVYFYDEGLMDGSPSYYQLVEVPNS